MATNKKTKIVAHVSHTIEREYKARDMSFGDAIDDAIMFFKDEFRHKDAEYEILAIEVVPDVPEPTEG